VVRIIPTDLSTSPPLFFAAVQKVRNFAPIFDPTRILSAVIWTQRRKSKTVVYSTDVLALIVKLSLKFDNWQNGYTALTQLHDDSQIFHIWAPISLERQKLETSNLVCAPKTVSSFDGIQNTRSKGTWPSLGDPDLNLRNPANISQTARSTGFKFSTQIDCREWKISSTKVGQRGHYISVMTTATDFKLGAHIAYRDYY